MRKIKNPFFMERGTGKSIAAVAVIILILGGWAFPRFVSASPEPTSFGMTSPGIASLIASVGDDTFSTTDLSVLLSALDPNGPTHYGPYGSSSPDSGTCGNNWADDTFARHFTVSTVDGMLQVVEQFKDGSFLTPSTTPPNPSQPANPSPGACQTSSTPAGFVNDGILGDLHGYFVIPLPGETQTSTSAYCNAMLMTNSNCDTATFIDTHFTPPCYGSGACSATTFFFHYNAGDQGLISHEWKNASPDRGGNTGDIRSVNAP
jgi:hypothetical protein